MHMSDDPDGSTVLVQPIHRSPHSVASGPADRVLVGDHGQQERARRSARDVPVPGA